MRFIHLLDKHVLLRAASNFIIIGLQNIDTSLITILIFSGRFYPFSKIQFQNIFLTPQEFSGKGNPCGISDPLSADLWGGELCPCPL